MLHAQVPVPVEVIKEVIKEVEKPVVQVLVQSAGFGSRVFDPGLGLGSHPPL